MAATPGTPVATQQTIEELDRAIADVLLEIKGVDKGIKNLNARRMTLTAKYERLNERKQIYTSEAIANEQDWESRSFKWSAAVREALTNTFKLQNFRAQQLQTINCVLAQKDVLMLAPTGGGKSLCYQLPASISDGLTIVISPLISLMEDQVWSLKKIGIEAELLSAATDKNRNNLVLKQMMEKSNAFPFKLLYVTPERLAKSKRFMNALQKCYLAKRLHMIAIDEVHCCSQWGHDFRPDYKFLGTLKTMFPDVPVLGVTATATTKVILDVQKMLNIPQSIVLKAPFNRPNLFYHVMEKPSEKEKCVDLLYELLGTRYAGKSGIIYAFSISDTEDLALALTERGIKVRPYHANLTADRRTKIHQRWLTGDIQAVVATVAFGMGIDKPDVRFVIHHTISKSMENFYQESGRAGRDGLRSECILLYRFNDMSRITTMMFTEHTGLQNAYKMIDYATDGISCRRDLIGKHFADVWSDTVECNKMCDRCYHEDSVQIPKMIITEHCLDLYRIINRAVSIDVKLTALKLVDAWYQKGATNLRVKDVEVPKLERYYAEQIIAHLVIKEYLKEDFHFSTYTTYSYIRKGNRVATKDDRIVFYGARVHHLPESNATLWNDGRDDAECVFVSEERIKRKKKPKKDKQDRTSKNSHDENSFNCSSSTDDNHHVSSTGHTKTKRRRMSSEVAVISSTNNESAIAGSSKKKKQKSKTRTESTGSVYSEDDCQVLSQPQEIIQIDD